MLYFVPMRRLSVLVFAVVGFVASGQAFGFDYRIDPSAQNKSAFRFALAEKSPLAVDPAGTDLAAAVPAEYATAMTWYRVALANGYEPPLVVQSWTYSDQLPEPLQYAWSAPNGDLVARVGKGAFLLSFEDTDRNWFRELNCRMTVWPGGDAQAVMACNDGTERTMLIPEEGGVVIGNRQYSRAFQQAPVNFDDALPDASEPLMAEPFVE
ncbi:MAG: hypothetical protein JNK47_11610 [Mesorhizobium sp.]|nr:hypothetical protein [Mesorhizobium sp.]MBL8577866.1 hypothetical protein [Mesorhizobium sp.]